MGNSRQILLNNLRALFSGKGTQSEFARFAGLSPVSVNGGLRERKKAKVPTPENLDDIARFFQIEVSDLFSERPLNSTERRVLYILARLNDEERAFALQTLELFLKNSAWSKESELSESTGS